MVTGHIFRHGYKFEDSEPLSPEKCSSYVAKLRKGGVNKGDLIQDFYLPDWTSC